MKIAHLLHRFSLLLAGAYVLAGTVACTEEGIPPTLQNGPYAAPPDPTASEPEKLSGQVVVELTFGRKGDVTNTRVLQSTAGSLINLTAIHTLSSRWHNRPLANRTAVATVNYGPVALSPAGRVVPPAGQMLLRVTFDEGGRARHWQVVDSTGKQTDHSSKHEEWTVPEYAGTTVDIPFSYSLKVSA